MRQTDPCSRADLSSVAWMHYFDRVVTAQYARDDTIVSLGVGGKVGAQKINWWLEEVSLRYPHRADTLRFSIRDHRSGYWKSKEGIAREAGAVKRRQSPSKAKDQGFPSFHPASEQSGRRSWPDDQGTASFDYGMYSMHIPYFMESATWDR